MTTVWSNDAPVILFHLLYPGLPWPARWTLPVGGQGICPARGWHSAGGCCGQVHLVVGGKHVLATVVTTGAKRCPKAPVKSSPLTNQHPVFFTDRMPFLSLNQQCQSTEGTCARPTAGSNTYCNPDRGGMTDDCTVTVWSLCHGVTVSRGCVRWVVGVCTARPLPQSTANSRVHPQHTIQTEAESSLKQEPHRDKTTFIYSM